MIYVDTRESRSLVPGLLEPQVGLNNIEKKQLLVGDYLVTGSEGMVCIERKAAPDFINSLYDGRLNNELYKMSTFFDYSIVLVEGDIFAADLMQRMKIQLMMGTIAGMVLRRSPDGKQGAISALPTLTQEGSALFIGFIHKKISQEGGTIRLFHLPKIKADESERQEAILETVPLIGKNKSRRLLQKFGTVKGVVNATEDELKTVEGIGEKLSKNIYEVFNRRYERLGERDQD